MTSRKTLECCRHRQTGAALVVGLLLLVVITVLAISGMNTATTDLAMARNDQAYEDAFQAAETGLAAALSQGRFETSTLSTVPVNISELQKVSTEIQFEDSTLVPDMAFSLGVGSGISAARREKNHGSRLGSDPHPGFLHCRPGTVGILGGRRKGVAS
jgi:type IV pilus assembly protein PilX